MKQTKQKEPTEFNFVLGNGRCGTNMLAKILEECGAKFGSFDITQNPSGDYWTQKEKIRIGGYMEDPNIGKSMSYVKKYYELRRALPFIPVFFIAFLRKRGVKKFFDSVSDGRQWILHNSVVYYLDDIRELMNIKPKVMGVVRHPVEQMGSFYTSFGSYSREHEAHDIYKRYFNVNMRLISHIEKYGGTLVCWDDISDMSKENWAKSISKSFKEFKVHDLLEARKKVLDPTRPRNKGKTETYFLPKEYSDFWEYLLGKVREYEG